MKNTAAGLLSIAVLVVAGLVGAPRDALARRALAAVRACMTISADAERLACYDRALGVERTERGGEVQGVQAPRREAPPVAQRASADERETQPPPEKQPPAPADVEVTVVQVRRTPRVDTVSFITKDGQVWRQTDQKNVMFPHPPFRAVISAGALGSHFLTPAGERVDIRVARQ